MEQPYILIFSETPEGEDVTIFKDHIVLGLYYATSVESAKAKYLDTEGGKQLKSADYWRVLALPLKERKQEKSGLVYGFDHTKPLGIAEI